MIKTNSEREFFQLTVNRNTVPIGKVDFEGGRQVKKTDLTKSGSYKTDKIISYHISINQSGKEISDAKVTDILSTPKISYIKNSFKIEKGKWVIVNNRWVLKNKINVTEQFTINFISDSQFSVDLGHIKAGEGYRINYKAKANYNLQNGEIVENIASLWSSKIKIINSIVKTTYREASGNAEDYVYSITLHKKDEVSGMPLTGAIFRVIRDRNGTTVGEFITDSAGEVTSLNLLKDTYKIKEIKAPAGY